MRVDRKKEESETMKIAFLSQDQHGSMIDLLCELHTYYNDTDADRDLVATHFQKNLLADNAGMRLVTTSDMQGNVMGFAAIIVMHSLVEPHPDNCRQCLMKELFVSAQYRGQGLGRSLMVWIAKYAQTQGCGRLDWNVKADNEAGIAFYEGIGARFVSDRLNLRLSKEALTELNRRAI